MSLSNKFRKVTDKLTLRVRFNMKAQNLEGVRQARGNFQQHAQELLHPFSVIFFSVFLTYLLKSFDMAALNFSLSLS